jgi:hypothetical protein
MLDAKRQDDKTSLLRAFGGDQGAADRFAKLDRLTNSQSSTTADAAAKELNQIEASFTDEQKRLIYGYGEENVPQVDDIKDVLREHEDHDGLGDQSNAQLIDQMGSAIRSTPHGSDWLKVPQGTANSRTQAAFVRFGLAHRELSARGVDTSDLGPQLVESLVRRGYGKPSDVAEIVGGFMSTLDEARSAHPKPDAAQMRLTDDNADNPRTLIPQENDRDGLVREQARQAGQANEENLTKPDIAERPSVRPSQVDLGVGSDSNVLGALTGEPRKAEIRGALSDLSGGQNVLAAENPEGIARSTRNVLAEAGAEASQSSPSRNVLLPPDESAPLPSRSAGGLREAPRPGAVAGQNGVVGRAAFAGERVAQVGRRLKQALELTVRQGRMTLKGNAIGEFHQKTGVIRTKAGPEINVVAHEGGHALEAKNYPSLSAALKANESHLRTLAYPGAAPGTHRQEGFAEFFRWYVTNPAHAQKVAPKFYGEFERAMEKDAPKVLADLKELQSAYQDYLAAPSSGVVASNVVQQKPANIVTRYADAYKEDGTGAVGMAADEAYTAAVDRFHPVNMALRELRRIAGENGRTIGDLTTSKNPYRLARMASGSYAAGHMNIMEGVRPYQGLDAEGPSLQKALVSALGKNWKDEAFNDFGAYLISRRMQHEWTRFEAGALKRPPDMLSAEAHAQAIKDFDAAHPKWSDAASQVTGWANQLWRKRYESGLIGEETYVRGLSEHPDYVPAQRDLSDKTGGLGGTGKAGKFAGGSPEFKGSDRPFLNPVQSLMRESFDLEGLIARNDVLKALEDVADRAGTGSGAIVERIPAKQLEPVQIDAIEAAHRAAEAAGLSERDREAMLANLEAHLGDAAQVTMFQSRPINERGEPIIYSWRDGERVPLRLPDGEFGKQMFDSLAGMTPPQKSIFLEALAAVSHVQRFGITTNPAFTLRNFFRDQFGAWMLTDVGYKPFLSGARGALDELTNAKIAKRYNAMGGLMGGANVASMGEARNLKPKALAGESLTWTGLARTIAKVSEISETGTRLGIFRNAFRTAKKAGRSDYDASVDAIYEARDFFDTDLHGSRMVAAKRILPFFNANVQGIRKALATATADGQLHKLLAPIGKAAPTTPDEKAAYVKAYKLWAKMSALGVAGASLTALYLKDPEYKEFDDQERATYWMVKGPGGWVKLPKPFELAALSNIFERGVERFYGNDPTAWERMRKGLGQILIPPVQTPVLTVPFEIASNKDYAGRPIVPDQLRGKVDPVLQSNSYTSELGLFLGKTLHVSPAIVDHAISGVFGTWGQDALHVSNKLKPGQPPAMSREDVPILSAYRTTPERGTASASKFWDLMASTGGKFAEAQGSYRHYILGGDPKAAAAYLSHLDEPTRDYVLSQTFTENGSGKFHPMERARLANSVLGELRQDITNGDPVRGVNGRPIQLSPTQRRDADKALSELQMAELSNGLKGAGVTGWDNRDYIARKPALAALYAAAPPLKDVLNLRLSAAKIPPPNMTATMWPQIKARLNDLSPREMGALLESERAHSPATKLDEALKRRAAN